MCLKSASISICRSKTWLYPGTSGQHVSFCPKIRQKCAMAGIVRYCTNQINSTMIIKWLPSGKHTKSYGKSPFGIGKSTVHEPFSIAMLNYQWLRKNGALVDHFAGAFLWFDDLSWIHHGILMSFRRWTGISWISHHQPLQKAWSAWLSSTQWKTRLATIMMFLRC